MFETNQRYMIFSRCIKYSLYVITYAVVLFPSREERRAEIKEKRAVKVSNIVLLHYLQDLFKNFRSGNDLETSWYYGYEYLFFTCTMEYSTTKFIHRKEKKFSTNYFLYNCCRYYLPTCSGSADGGGHEGFDAISGQRI